MQFLFLIRKLKRLGANSALFEAILIEMFEDSTGQHWQGHMRALLTNPLKLSLVNSPLTHFALAFS